MVQPPIMNTFSLGNTLMQAEQINAMRRDKEVSIEKLKGMRTKNALSAMSLEDEKKRRANLEKIAEVERYYETAPEQIRALRDAGDWQAAKKLEADVRQKLSGTLDLYGKLAERVVDQDSYDQVREMAIQNGLATPEQLPSQFSKSILRRAMKKPQNILRQLDQVTKYDPETGIRTMRTDTIDSYGNRLGSSPEYANPDDLARLQRERDSQRRAATANRRENRLSAKDKGGGTLKSSQSNSVRSGVAMLYGGSYDRETNRYIINDNAKREEAAEVAARADEYLVSGQASSANIAVRMAAQDFGIRLPGAQMRQGTNSIGADSIGLR